MSDNTTNTQAKKSGLSTAGFVCSLCGFLTCGITSIIGLILSIIGLSNSKKEGRSDGLAIAGIIISLLPLVFGILILALGGSSSSSSSNETTTNNNDNGSKVTETTKPAEKTYTKVSVDDLEEALENNAASAKDTYKGKYLEITGKLGTIDSDLKYISLDSMTKEIDFTGIHCTIKDNQTKETVKTLSKGQTIIVKGKIKDVGEVLGYYLDIDEIIPQ